MILYYPFSDNDLLRLYQFDKKVLQVYSFDVRCTRWESGKKAYWTKEVLTFKSKA